MASPQYQTLRISRQHWDWILEHTQLLSIAHCLCPSVVTCDEHKQVLQICYSSDYDVNLLYVSQVEGPLPRYNCSNGQH
jgi:hypothetical protein